MIDIKLIRENPDFVENKKKKFQDKKLPYFIILILLLLLFLLSMPNTHTRDNIDGTLTFLKIWLCIYTINFVIRRVQLWLFTINKNSAQQSTKLTYDIVLIYILIALGATPYSTEKRELIYLAYTLYIALCCTYQLIAYIKHYPTLSWILIYPHIPFYAYPISLLIVEAIDLYYDSLLFTLLAGYCFMVIPIFIITTYSLYKLDKLETQNQLLQKIVWGILLLLACTRALYIYNIH